MRLGLIQIPGELLESRRAIFCAGNHAPRFAACKPHFTNFALSRSPARLCAGSFPPDSVVALPRHLAFRLPPIGAQHRHEVESGLLDSVAFMRRSMLSLGRFHREIIRFSGFTADYFRRMIESVSRSLSLAPTMPRLNPLPVVGALGRETSALRGGERFYFWEVFQCAVYFFPVCFG